MEPRHENDATQSRNETCVLLAGGAGRRLDRVTAGLNKHLLEINGRPALGYVIDAILATTSVERLVVVTRSDSLMSIEALLERARERVDVVMRLQARPAGTLDAVVTAQSAINHDSFAVHYGDNLFAWRQLPPLRAALRNDAVACLYTVHPPMDWRRYAAVTTVEDRDGESVVAGLKEKPVGGYDCGNFRSLTGFLRFDTQAFLRASPRVRISPRGELELTDALELMLKSGRVLAANVRLAWADFGTERGLRAAPGVIAARGLAPA